AIGMVVGLIAKDPQPIKYAGSLLGIAGIGALVYICLVLGEPLLRLLGRSGVDAFTRILGFFILAIAIQLTIDGTLSVLQEFPLAELSIFPASAH
ncbi:MAG: MarC family protein, partial [Cyanobacteria bacterium P01_D01_bin.123]